ADVEVYNGTTWTNVLSMDASDGYPDPANIKSIDITAAAGGSAVAQVRFVYTGDWDYWWAIDNVLIEDISCFWPDNVTASAVTDLTATINWVAPATAPANGYDYYYNTTGVAPTAATTPSGSVGAGILTADLTGLIANTDYFVWVRSLCGTTDISNWSPVGTFTTDCGAMTAPWLYTVENATPTTSAANIADCWTASPTSGYSWCIDGAGSTPSSLTGPDGAFSGSNYFYVEASSGIAGSEALLTSPPLAVSSLTVPA